MNLSLPVRTIIAWLLFLISLSGVSLLGMGTYDYYQYKSAYVQLQVQELKEAESILEKERASAMKLGSLIAERIVASGGRHGKVQGILSSVNYLASLEGLPPVQAASYIPFRDPSIQITRFGTQSNVGAIDVGRPDSVVLDNQGFVSYSQVKASAEVLGALSIRFDVDFLKKKLNSLSTLSLDMTGKQGEVKNYKGFLLYVLEPMNFAEFMMIDLGGVVKLTSPRSPSI